MIQAGVFVPLDPTQAGRVWRAVGEAGHPLTPDGLRAWMLEQATRPRGVADALRSTLSNPQTVETLAGLLNVARLAARK
jgi:hypothetical protein